MQDCFALFGQPRRPWLDAETLKEKFNALAAAHHPDVARDGTVDFTALNTAHETLRDPARRVRHLIGLEFPGALAHSARIPESIGDLFMQIAALQQECGALLKKRELAATPLARAMIEPEKLALLEKVGALSGAVTAQQTRLLDELRRLDAEWMREKSAAAAALAALLQSLAFVSKWSAQLHETKTRLVC